MTEDEKIIAMLQKSRLSLSSHEYEDKLLGLVRKLRQRQRRQKIISIIVGQVCMLVCICFLVYRLMLLWLQSFSKEFSISNAVRQVMPSPLWASFSFYLLPLMVFIISSYMAVIRKSSKL